MSETKDSILNALAWGHGEVVPYCLLKVLPLDEAVMFCIINARIQDEKKFNNREWLPIEGAWLEETFPLLGEEKARRVIRRLVKRRILEEKPMLFEDHSVEPMETREALAYRRIAATLDLDGQGVGE